MARLTLSGADKAERLAYRAVFIPKHARLYPTPSGCAVYVYEMSTCRTCSPLRDALPCSHGEPRYVAMVYRGTAAKPEFHTSYRTPEQREANIAAFVASVQAHAERKSVQAAKKAAWVNTYKIGDIFATCWGYDQTNVDFYVATRVSARCVWVRPIAADYEGTGFMSGKTWPKMPIEMHGAETKHVASEGGLNINGHHASLETGRDHYTSSYA